MKFQNKMNTLKINPGKYIAVLLLAGVLCTQAQHVQAQNGMRRQAIREQAMDRLLEAKWGFIIFRLNLTEERSNRLLPVYKAYEAEKRNIVLAKAQQLKGNKDAMDDQQAEVFINTRLENAQKLLDLKEKYKPQFLAILSPKELLQLQNAEQDFAMKVMMERQKRKAAQAR